MINAGKALLFILAGILCLSSAKGPHIGNIPISPACEESLFSHPGLLTSNDDLIFLREQVKNGKEPWATAYRNLVGASASGKKIGELSYQPTAIKVVAAGPAGERNDDIERRDAHAAYAHALQWVVSQDERHAQKAIDILNTWAYNYESREESINKTLSVGWSAPVFMRAAEIVRYTYSKYKPEDVQALASMMRDKFLPLVFNGARTTAGNWETSMAEAVMSIGVFLNDRQVFNQGLTLIKRKIPEYLYVVEDGQWPVLPPQKANGSDVVKYLFWYRGGNPGGIASSPPPNYNLPYRFYDGQCQETCRDMNHTQLGIGAALNCLEIAYTQGIDLYATYRDRLVRAMEFNSKVMIDIEEGRGVPSDLCGGIIALADTRFMAFEVGYNHYHHRLKIDMPYTEAFIKLVRGAQFRYNPILHIAFPAFTHQQLTLKKPSPINDSPSNFSLTVVRAGERNAANLEWTASSDNDGIAGYSIYEDTTLVETVSPSITRYEMENLEPGKNYRYQVIAKDNCGNLTASNEISFSLSTETSDVAVAPRKIFSRSRDTHWKIDGMDQCADCVVTVFSRSGVKVFEGSQYATTPWGGSFKATTLSDGVYSFLIKRNGRVIKSGTITLMP